MRSRRSEEARRLHAAYVGCSGWNYSAWRAEFYPAKLPARRWLE